MVARFRDNIDNSWSIHKLNHWDRSDDPWVNESGHGYDWCQVYDAPDPGEGWRLIDTASEKWQEGDEFQHDDGMWKRSLNGRSSGFSERFFYRRRIEPAVTYIPFTWEDRDQLRGRWIKESDNVEIQVTAFHCNSEGVFYSEGRSAKVLVERWRFLDTGKPVGKEVAQ